MSLDQTAVYQMAFFLWPIDFISTCLTVRYVRTYWSRMDDENQELEGLPEHVKRKKERHSCETVLQMVRTTRETVGRYWPTVSLRKVNERRNNINKYCNFVDQKKVEQIAFQSRRGGYFWLQKRVRDSPARYKCGGTKVHGTSAAGVGNIATLGMRRENCD